MAEQTKSIFDNFREFVLIPIDKSLLLTVPEIGHLSPIVLIAGSLFMSVVTLNYPLAVFGLSCMEASLVYRLISPFADYIKTPSDGIEQSAECKSYFQLLTTSRFKGLLENGIKTPFPNYSLYYIAFAVLYCIQGLLAFSNESSAMGSSYSSRPYLSIIGGTLFILLYGLYLFVYGCDGILSLLLTVFIGALVGYLISYQNISLLGKTSVDLLYIPPLINRSGMDYICVTTNKP
jgi:hypothetical protein